MEIYVLYGTVFSSIILTHTKTPYILIISIYQMGNWGLQSLSTFPKVVNIMLYANSR